MIKKLHRWSFRALLLSSICFLSNHSYGQYIFFNKPVYELGISAGPSNLLGDLGGTYGTGKTFLKDNNIQMTKLLKGVHFTVRPSEFLGITLAANFTTLEGADSIIVDKGGPEVARKNRNLSVRTRVQELTLTGEIYPLVFLENDERDLFSKFRPYGIIGVGAFHFNPQGQYTAPDGSQKWVDLKPLRTEGQGMPQYPDKKEYSLTQINIPYGVGIRYYFSDRLSASLEIVNRKTFTDYIDDINSTFIDDSDFDSYFGSGSQTAAIAKQMHNKAQQVSPGVRIPYYNAGDKRGTASNNDSYYSATIKVAYRFGGNGFSSGIMRCPITF